MGGMFQSRRRSTPRADESQPFSTHGSAHKSAQVGGDEKSVMCLFIIAEKARARGPFLMFLANQ
jgi:hypothetical protein